MGKWVDVSICMWTVDCGLCGMSNLRQVNKQTAERAEQREPQEPQNRSQRLRTLRWTKTKTQTKLNQSDLNQTRSNCLCLARSFSCCCCSFRGQLGAWDLGQAATSDPTLNAWENLNDTHLSFGPSRCQNLSCPVVRVKVLRSFCVYGKNSNHEKEVRYISRIVSVFL